ncbi:MAG: hypothetical protein K2M46_01765 [Lachnospiraceae bacterium]|nr:hypothetical protein [Lachnospiraceae bacterium]
MTPQGLVICVVFLAVCILAFIYDKKKADKSRNTIDTANRGQHTADFKRGYIANNTLYLKHRVKGYLSFDLTKVTEVGISRWNGFYSPIIVSIDPEHPILSSLKGNGLKYDMSYKTACEILTAIDNNCPWINVDYNVQT